MARKWEVPAAAVAAVLSRLVESAGRFDEGINTEDVRRVLVEPVLKNLGIGSQQFVDRRAGALALDLKQYFALRNAGALARAFFGGRFGNRSIISSANLEPGADRALIRWANDTLDELIVTAGPVQYDKFEGVLDPPETCLRDGHMVVTGRSFYFCCYKKSRMLVSFHDRDVQRNGISGWEWLVEVVWAETPKDAAIFLMSLASRITRQMVEERRGQVLSASFQPTILRTWRMDQLAFAPDLRADVGDLVDAFDAWQSPECPTKRWGAALVGGPGTGKTTIGGVLVGRKYPECTVLYLKAADFLNLPPGVNQQHIVRNVFAWAGRLEPVLMIVDDFDLIAPHRGHGYYDPITSCFMESLDGLHEQTKLFFVVTSNRPDIIESALIDRPGRMGTRIWFEGFESCFPDLLRSQAHHLGLSWDDNVLAGLANDEDYAALLEAMTVTPDVAANVMARVTLSKERILTPGTLMRAMRATIRAFGKRVTDVAQSS